MNHKTKYNDLIAYIQKLDSVLVAFSGGVDSTLLLAAALDALGRDKVLAVTATSPIHPVEELMAAQMLASEMGVKWQVMHSREMENPEFLANPTDRCYYCKKERLAELVALAASEGLAHVVEGSNFSDLNDHRPGFRAVQENGVLSPMLEIGMTKEEIRSASRDRELSNWNKPSNACLCSRIPYGEPITLQRLKRIDLAEKAVTAIGVGSVRVRDHGNIARIEVLQSGIEKLCCGENRDIVTKKILNLGFKYVTVDLMGYRTGSMNS